MTPIRLPDPRRFGRRGAFLLLFGVIWAALGYGWMRYPPHATPALDVLLYWAPPRTWAGLWIVCGAAAMVAAFFRQPGRDTFGYVALMIPVMLYCGSNLVAFVGGYDRGMLSALVYLAIALAVVIVAGWPEPPPRR